VTAPIYVAVNSRCKEHKPDPDIRQAQMRLVDISHGILLGPDTDMLGLAYRFDGCYFSDEGLEKASELWVDALIESKVAFRH
jgi:hypothetical protein